jgi:hypothetical protein
MTSVAKIFRRHTRPTDPRRGFPGAETRPRAVRKAGPGPRQPVDVGVAMMGDLSGLVLNEPTFGLGR